MVTVTTPKGKIELTPDEIDQADFVVAAAFDIYRRNRGLTSDAIMALAHVVTDMHPRRTYALAQYIKDMLTPYQDTRDQTRYTQTGEYEPFTEKYKKIRQEVIEKLKSGEKVAVLENHSVQNRVIYDMLANNETSKSYGGRVAGWMGER